MKETARKTSPKMLQIMTDLGFKEKRSGIFVHQSIGFDEVEIDLTATADDSIMYVLASTFWHKGHDDCKDMFRKFIGV